MAADLCPATWPLSARPICYDLSLGGNRMLRPGNPHVCRCFHGICVGLLSRLVFAQPGRRGPRYAVLPVSSELCPLRPASKLWGEIAQGPPCFFRDKISVYLWLAWNSVIQVFRLKMWATLTVLGSALGPFLSFPFFFFWKVSGFP